MLPGVGASTRFLKLLANRKVWALLAVTTLAATYPYSCGALGGRLVASKLAKKLALPVEYAKARGGWGELRIFDMTIGPKQSPLLSIPMASISFAAAWGSGMVTLESPRAEIRRGVPGDNLNALLGRLRKPPTRSGASKPASYPTVVVQHGSLSIVDGTARVTADIANVDATFAPSRSFSIVATEIGGHLGTQAREDVPAFGAKTVTVECPLDGLRPRGFPQVSVEEGRLLLLSRLPLTGIAGSLRPSQNGDNAVDVLFSGSYAGAKRSLWTATGKLKPTLDWSSVDGQVALRAERFSLDKIAEVLPASILEPENTEVDAAIEARFTGRQIALAGNLEVVGLSLSHERLATEPVQNATFALRFDGTVDRDKRRVDISTLEGKIGSLVTKLYGFVELPLGTFRFKDGRELGVVPKIDLSLRVPRTPCAKILASIPAPLVPRLQGFALQGQFEADVRVKVDFGNLETIDVGGKVGIDGCQVTKAPEDILALAGPESLLQSVEVPPPPLGGKDNEVLTFAIGPDNPEFVPYEKLSPYLIAAIMTTEDSGFFKHRGWVSSEFKTALKRNIAGGGFRLGASSITMQMVKNVILGREKTLSRKFQELFLSWYVEKFLTKERILELYFNAIEFGPRIYGIGAATRHYFGKYPSELTPLEAAFFSSILPSPKRRYVQYCHGALTPQWDKYLRRILSKMHERGRLNEDEYTAALASTLVFDKTEMNITEKQCNEWVKKITTKPEVEPEPEAESQ